MKNRVALVGVLGLLVAGYLIWHTGFAPVFSAVVAIGWRGFSLLCAFAFVVFALLGTAWWVLMAGSPAATWRTAVWARLVRDSASETLPLSQLGGFVFGARAAVLDGVAPALAAASMIADITTEMIAQIVYVCLGIVLLGAQSRTAMSMPSTGWMFAGVAMAGLAAAGFFAVQRYGGGMTQLLAVRFLPRAAEHAEAVTSELESIYRMPGRVAASVIVHVTAWIASGAATWIALRLLGAPVGLVAVIGVESLVSGLRSAAFAVPNAIGVQEAAYAGFAPILGVGPEFGLAISILKRARDIAIGVPVLLVWQALEGSRAIAVRANN